MTVCGNAELIERFEWGWEALGDRGRLLGIVELCGIQVSRNATLVA